jgi:predicted dehydrogenase
MVRVGLIGAGTMGRLYAQCLAEGSESELVAIADLDAARADHLAEEWSAASSYSNCADMLAAERLDAVVVATPDEAHRAPVIAALEAGLHVLCEKPLATTVEDGLAIREAVSRSGKSLMVNFGNRHRPEVQALRRAIMEEQSVGDIGTIYVELNERIGKTETLQWAARTSPIWFLLSHCVDTVRYATGREIAEVFCCEARQILVQRGVDTSDTALCVGTLDNGGTIFLGSSWAYPDGFARDLDFTLRVLGARGLLESQLFGQSVVLHDARPHVVDYQFPHLDYTGKRDSWWFQSTRYFVHCIASGVRPTPDVEDGLKCLQVLRAMDESVRTKQPVAVAGR